MDNNTAAAAARTDVDQFIAVFSTMGETAALIAGVIVAASLAKVFLSPAR